MLLLNWTTLENLIATGLLDLIVNLVVVCITGLLTYSITKYKLEKQLRQSKKELMLRKQELKIKTQELRLKRYEVVWGNYLQRFKLGQEFALRKKELALKERELELRKLEFEKDN
jgi:hypothetical protein